MSVGYSNSTSNVTATGTAPGTAAPSLSDGDVVVLRIQIFNLSFSGTTAGTVITPPTGFVLRDRVEWAGGVGAGSCSDAVFTKLITNAAGEPGTYTFTLSVSSYSEVDASAYTGCDASSASAHFDTITQNIGTSQTATAAALTVARNSSMLVFQSCNSNQNFSGDPSGYTLRVNYDGNVNSWDSPAAAGSSGTPSVGIVTPPGGSSWYVHLLSLQPPAAAGATDALFMGNPSLI